MTYIVSKLPKKNTLGHDDLDAFSGQLSKIISTATFDTPKDIVNLVNNVWEERPQGTKFRTQGLHAKAAQLDETMDWKSWTSALGVKLKGLRAKAEHDLMYYVLLKPQYLLLLVFMAPWLNMI